MAKNDDDDAYYCEKIKPPMLKGRRGIEDSANNDRLPIMPNPGQILLQKNGKKD